MTRIPPPRTSVRPGTQMQPAAQMPAPQADPEAESDPVDDLLHEQETLGEAQSAVVRRTQPPSRHGEHEPVIPSLDALGQPSPYDAGPPTPSPRSLTTLIEDLLVPQLAALRERIDGIAAGIGPAVREAVEDSRTISDEARDQLADELRTLLASTVRLAKLDLASAASGRPHLAFAQARKWAQHAPRVTDDGSVALLYNCDPAAPMGHEFTLPEVGSREVDFGFRLVVPEGWVAEVTTEGLSGQRTRVATLSGSTHPNGTLVLRLWSSARRTVRAGEEACRLHLHRVQPASVSWTDLSGNLSGGEDGAVKGAAR